MSLKKQIKTLVLLFVVLLLSFTTAAVLLFKENFSLFDKSTLDHSKNHAETLTYLAEIESGLYVYYDQLPCALAAHEDQCNQLIDSGRKLIVDGFTELQKINANEISNWASLSDFQSANPRKELSSLLKNFHKEKNITDSFQRLYYLVHLNTKQYVQNADKLLKETHKQSLTGQPQSISLATEDEHLEEIYLGLYAIKDQYNRIFWENSRAQSKRFAKNNRDYLFAMAFASAILLGFTISLALLIGRYFRLQQKKDEALAVLGAKDLITGLFNRRSMEALLGQELQRAKRHDYPLSLVMVRVEPYDNIKNQTGQMALDRLLFQIAEALKLECRAYDNVFKTDKNSFLVVFPEADPKIINSLIGRFRKRLGKKRFLVKSDQTKIQPTILLGAAGYPMNGSDSSELITFAEQTLSENFDAKVIHEHPDGVVSLSVEEPAEKILEQEVELATAAFETQTPAAVEETPQEEPLFVPPPVETIPTEEPTPPVADATEDVIETSLTPPAPPPIMTPIVVAPLPTTPPEDDIPDVVSALLPPEEATHALQATAKVPPSLEDELRADLSVTPKTASTATIVPNKDAILVDLDQERQKLAEKFRLKKSTL